MSKAKLPPIPPANRSPQGGSANPQAEADIPAQAGREDARSRDRNLGQQGHQGNIKQNTTHQGHQQDR